MFVVCLWLCVSLQSCDGSEYTLQGPAGGDDITGLSAEPAHYQLLSELGKNTTRSGQTKRSTCSFSLNVQDKSEI